MNDDDDAQFEALVADLAAEQAALRAAVTSIAPDDWFRPTPAFGWDVRDTISHLADTDELALETVVGGPRALNVVAAALASSEDVTYAGVLRGRRMAGRDVLAWWDRTTVAERDALRALAPDTRVSWGIGMRAPSFVTARLMETWAHGLDVHAALGVAPHDTARLRHVSWLAIRALPYAYSVAGREPPPGALRVELTGPDGDRWTFGPDDAPNHIRGSAGDLCRVFVQRLDVIDADLEADGDGAVAALQVARAYL